MTGKIIPRYMEHLFKKKEPRSYWTPKGDLPCQSQDRPPVKSSSSISSAKARACFPGIRTGNIALPGFPLPSSSLPLNPPRPPSRVHSVNIALLLLQDPSALFNDSRKRCPPPVGLARTAPYDSNSIVNSSAHPARQTLLLREAGNALCRRCFQWMRSASSLFTSADDAICREMRLCLPLLVAGASMAADLFNVEFYVY